MIATIAVTGGTGFVGARLIDLALAAGLEVRALARRPQPPRAGVTWVSGALEDRGALVGLASGADAVVHIAGVISAPSRNAFAVGNVAGTANMLHAAQAAGVRRFVHVSSLAAREPAISDYGWSKAASEARVAASGLDFTILRPPAVYGPGDRETLELFKMARRGIVALPPSGRLSLIEVGDLCRLILACTAGPESIAHTYEPDDGHAGGYDHREFAQLLGRAVGRRVRSVSVPAPILRAASRLDRLVRGTGAKLTADRVRYFLHPDWVVDPRRAAPPSLWRAQAGAADGLAATAKWYLRQGWLG